MLWTLEPPEDKGEVIVAGDKGLTGINALGGGRKSQGVVLPGVPRAFPCCDHPVREREMCE